MPKGTANLLCGQRLPLGTRFGALDSCGDPPPRIARTCASTRASAARMSALLPSRWS